MPSFGHDLAIDIFLLTTSRFVCGGEYAFLESGAQRVETLKRTPMHSKREVTPEAGGAGAGGEGLEGRSSAEKFRDAMGIMAESIAAMQSSIYNISGSFEHQQIQLRGVFSLCGLVDPSVRSITAAREDPQRDPGLPNAIPPSSTGRS